MCFARPPASASLHAQLAGWSVRARPGGRNKKTRGEEVGGEARAHVQRGWPAASRSPRTILKCALPVSDGPQGRASRGAFQNRGHAFNPGSMRPPAGAAEVPLELPRDRRGRLLRVALLEQGEVAEERFEEEVTVHGVPFRVRGPDPSDPYIGPIDRNPLVR